MRVAATPVQDLVADDDQADGLNGFFHGRQAARGAR
jgi:hypothetical protein